ncbi:MAG: PQQ-dependent sugar dehydrogenase [Pseudomonadales bacterium]|nr:PQQ-dependent sugar dehydrogenase [Pseudomonadales bacterium]MCP5184799.1 PQQ-dependent sugar dehydrogenase [Pseudomonadales bacterium]
MLTRLLPFVFAALAGAAAQAGYRLETVAEHLEKPWGMAFLPDGGLLVTEHPGRLRIVSADGTVGAPVAGVPAVFYESQGGLFDVVLHPDFADNRVIFLTYAEGDASDNGTAVARATLRQDGLTGSLDDLDVIFRVPRRKDTPVHYGGRMAFLPDGTFLLTTGDGFSYREEAQDIHSTLGKTLRMTADGKPAPGNPFADAPYVWTYGHRNEQGLAVTHDGTVWLHEHGPQGGDELNRILPGTNYGWPAICYCLDYTGAYVTPYSEWEGMAQPEHYWRPSIGPSGLAVYEGDAIPEWHGDIFVGALVNRELRRLHREADGSWTEEALFSDIGQRVRDVRAGPDGALYFSVEGENGRIFRVVGDSPPAASATE